MSEYLADTLLGDVPLEPADDLFKSPSGLIFECRRIARGVPIKIDQTEVFLDFHIFSILDFDLLIGYPLETLHLHGASQGSHNQELREAAFTTKTSCSKPSMVKHHPEHESLEEVRFISPFTSIDPALYEDTRLLTKEENDLGETLHLYKPKSTLILENELLEKEHPHRRRCGRCPRPRRRSWCHRPCRRRCSRHRFRR